MQIAILRLRRKSKPFRDVYHPWQELDQKKAITRSSCGQADVSADVFDGFIVH